MPAPIGRYSFEEYLELAAAFHGNPAPGLILGGYMVEAAKAALPGGILFDAVVETKKCLPDAVQLLTPLSYGNGWMRVANLGRYALTFYDKATGEGVRVWLDPAKVADWPEIAAWYLKTKPKKEQDREKLLAEIGEAGQTPCSLARVRIKPDFMRRRSMGAVAVCPVCGEGYPALDGGICRGCAGQAPYLQDEPEDPELLSIPAAMAVGKKALHDMTRIVPGESKGPEFRHGQTLTAGDVCRLQAMGRQNVYVADDNAVGQGFVHEDEAAAAFARAMAGEGVDGTGTPKEGKINLKAIRPGLLLVDKERLTAFNLLPGVMAASRQSHLLVESGKPVAGCRAIPLYLPRGQFEAAMRVLAAGPLFAVKPLRPAEVGILITGTEVVTGVIEDRFEPVVRAKVEALGCRVTAVRKVPDDRAAVAKAARELLFAGADLIVTTAGLSVDPDDVTRFGLLDAGLTDALYGMPVLPGAMTLVGKLSGADVIGVPACALFHRTTSFDLLLPRVLAGVPITRQELAAMAEGGMCLSCRSCTFPKCPFGK